MPADITTVIATKTTNGSAGASLSPNHLEHLKKSAISLEIIIQRGYQTVTAKKQLEALGFSKQQCRVPGILMPVHGVNGDGIVNNQFRPDSPRLNNRGRPIKYET